MNIMQLNLHHNPGKIIAGAGALKEIASELGQGSLPLIVTDQGISDSGILDRLTAVLEENQINYAVFSDCLPDPPDTVVQKAAAFYRESGCDTIIGLGGGSPMDVAKACGLLTEEDSSLSDFFSGKALPEKTPPIFAIPTTAGTGAEVSRVAIITDTKTHAKKVIRGPQLTPCLALLDPELLTGIPPKLAADTAADALAHAVESYVSKASTVFSEAFSLQALRLIAKNMIPAVENPGNLEATGSMLMASCMTGLAFANTGLGLVHALGHAVGARTHITHGRSCAIFMASVMKFNSSVCEEKFSLMAQALDVDTVGLTPEQVADKVIEKVSQLLSSVSIQTTLKGVEAPLTIDDEMITEIISSPPAGFNPRKPTREEVKEMLEAAF